MLITGHIVLPVVVKAVNLIIPIIRYSHYEVICGWFL